MSRAKRLQKTQRAFSIGYGFEPTVTDGICQAGLYKCKAGFDNTQLAVSSITSKFVVI
jgi:hypothetical protein